MKLSNTPRGKALISPSYWSGPSQSLHKHVARSSSSLLLGKVPNKTQKPHSVMVSLEFGNGLPSNAYRSTLTYILVLPPLAMRCGEFKKMITSNIGQWFTCFSFVDSNRLGTWNEGSFDRVTRGPDPINVRNPRAGSLWVTLNRFSRNLMLFEPMCWEEFATFPNLFVKFCWTNSYSMVWCFSPQWSRGGHHFHVDKFQSGIGNYLRAEILYRACISPFVNASELFSVNSKASSRLLSLCRTVPLEVFDLRLNKYGDRDEKAAFQSWLK